MTFERSIEEVLRYEGGYVNDPDDLGGETKYGITKRSYPDIDIGSLTLEDAKRLYQRDYWEKYSIEDLPDAYRMIYFDMIVNMGFRGASLVMQRALIWRGAKIKADGSFGPRTLAALRSIKPPVDLIQGFRVKRYIDIIRYRPRNEKFFLGWFRRAIAVR